MKEKTRIRVVIIDDSDMVRSLLRIILRDHQFDIVGEASNGKAGLDVCLRLKPDVVFLDVLMPIMNGIETLLAINENLQDTMVLMVTACDDDAIIKRAIENGASGFIVKPFNTSSIIETLDRSKSLFVVRKRAQVGLSMVTEYPRTI